MRGTITLGILLGSLGPAAALAANAPVTVSIDAAAAHHPINPQIYGVAFASEAQLADLGAPLNRQGGNSTSTYNWRQNVWNLDNDWYFESYPMTSASAGEAADSFMATNRKAGAAAMLTVPMIGWVARLGTGRAILPSFSVAKYGAQTATDPYFPDAGDGVKPGGAFVTGNDPKDAYVADSAAAEKAWIRHLTAKWGASSSGGVAYYILDNEPSIWFSTHRDIHPTGPHASEIRSDVIRYSRAIKAVDPTAKVVATEEWGWEGYFYSGFDQQSYGLDGTFPDHAASGMDYIPWLLRQWKAAGHPIDVLSVHFYPQGAEFSDDDSTATQLLRNRSTRQLWDPGYVSESWIKDVAGGIVELIPRLKQWAASDYYAGTPVGITEYNWGDEAHINGATAQADIYGIFGREGLDLATRWTVPDPATPTYKAMKLYRNYDGHHSGFGETSVGASAPNPDSLSAFAALRAADGALTVMVVSKVRSGDTPVTLDLANFAGGTRARVYQLTSTNAIARIANAVVTASHIATSLPAQSVTLFVLPPATAP